MTKCRKNNFLILQKIKIMKVGLIRHFPVKKRFLKGLVTQDEVLQWFNDYNEAMVTTMSVDVGLNWQKCYSSTLKRTITTAEAIYQGEILSTAFLNEPFPDRLFKRNFKLPFIVWGLLLRFALLYNHRSQSQCKSFITSRIKEFLPQITAQGNTDLLIVGHVFTMEILSKVLLENGFKGKKIRSPKNGVLHVFEK